MQCLRYQPAPDLIPWLVHGLEWRLDKNQFIPEIFPGTGAEIIFNMGDALSVTGLSPQDLSRNFSIAPGTATLLCPRYSRLSFTAHGHIHLASLRLRSAACFGLFGIPVEQICDQVLPLSELEVTPPPAEFISQWKGRDLGHWMRQRLSQRPAPDPALVQVIEKLYYGMSGAELQQQLGISARTFQRRLRHYTGVDMRYFQRTARFQRTLRRLLSGAPLFDALLDGGYCDQSHFIKSCQFFTQRSPKYLLTPEHKALNHYNPQVNRLAGSL